jgi:hypothetical protein
MEMEIHVHWCNSKEPLKVMVTPCLFVEELKIMIYDTNNWSFKPSYNQCYMIFCRKHLKDGHTLAEYGVTECDKIYLGRDLQCQYCSPRRRITEEDYMALVYARQLSR